MMRFTEDDAQYASEVGNPIMLDKDWVRDLLNQHHIEFEEFIDAGLALPIDAAELLTWLGY